MGTEHFAYAHNIRYVMLLYRIVTYFYFTEPEKSCNEYFN